MQRLPDEGAVRPAPVAEEAPFVRVRRITFDEWVFSHMSVTGRRMVRGRGIRIHK